MGNISGELEALQPRNRNFEIYNKFYEFKRNFRCHLIGFIKAQIFVFGGNPLGGLESLKPKNIIFEI